MRRGGAAQSIDLVIGESALFCATGISDSVGLIEGNEFDGQRKVIDVAGDGEDNGTADLEAARQAATGDWKAWAVQGCVARTANAA